MQPDQPTSTIREAPPWKLKGNGWVLLYRFQRDFVLQNGFIPGYLQDAFRGGIGAVMLVDYRTSPVGPYRELLFIPGVFRHGRRKYYAITKIYVSTPESVINGQENWGIPKELADFTIETADDVHQRFAVSLEGYTFFEAVLEEGVVRFPVNTAFVPPLFSPKLLQQRDDGTLLVTSPYAAGVIGPASTLHSLHIDGRGFPDVSEHNPLGVIQAVSFRMTFPVPTTP